MHKINFTTQELQIIIAAFNTLTIKGSEARVIGLLLDKIETELEKTKAKQETEQK